MKELNYIINKKEIYLYNKNNEITVSYKDKLVENIINKLLMNPTKSRINNKLKYKYELLLSDLQFNHTNTNVSIRGYYYIPYNNTINKLVVQRINNLNKLEYLLTQIYNKKVSLQIKLIKKPYLNTKILALFLGQYYIKNTVLKSRNFTKLTKLLFNKIKLNKTNNIRKDLAIKLYNKFMHNFNVYNNNIHKKEISYYILNILNNYINNLNISGLKIELAGRTNKRRIATRSKSLVTSIGTFQSNNTIYKNGNTKSNISKNQFKTSNLNGALCLKITYSTSNKN